MLPDHLSSGGLSISASTQTLFFQLLFHCFDGLLIGSRTTLLNPYFWWVILLPSVSGMIILHVLLAADAGRYPAWC